MLKSKQLSSKKIQLNLIEKDGLRAFYSTKKLLNKMKSLLDSMEDVLYKNIKFGPKNLEINLEFTSNYQIKKINRIHRHKNKITDVLSFPLNEDLRDLKNLKFSGNPVQLGDVLICIPRANSQAKKFKVTIEDEIIHLIVHGVLHLVGYDHEISEIEEVKMQKLEDLIIDKMIKKRGP